MSGFLSSPTVRPVIHFSAESQPSLAPVLRARFPISVQQGKVFQTTVLGKALNNVYGIWFESSGLANLRSMDLCHKKSNVAHSTEARGKLDSFDTLISRAS